MTPGPSRSGAGSPRWTARSSAMYSRHSSGPPGGQQFGSYPQPLGGRAVLQAPLTQLGEDRH